MEQQSENLWKSLQQLSEPLKAAWAKSEIRPGSSERFWLPLVGHAMDAVGVAGFFWDHVITNAPKEVMTRPFGQADDPEASAREFLCVLAGLHDAGKLTPPFARQVPDLAYPMAHAGLPLKNHEGAIGASEHWVKHGLAGSLIMEMVGSSNELAWDRSYLHAMSTLVGGHHGVPVKREQKQTVKTNPRPLGWNDPDETWKRAQVEFVTFVLDYVKDRSAGEAVVFTLDSLVLFEGYLVLIDWVASSADYFPLTSTSDTAFNYLKGEGGQFKRVERGLEVFSPPRPWQPLDHGEDTQDLLTSRFKIDLPPRPLQEAAVRLARESVGPCLLIIEDAMGAGKTEAAFLAAEILAAKRGSGGLLVTLPTQATTDAMFARMMRYLEEVPDRKGEMSSVSLLHGRSRWNQEYRDLKRAGRLFLDNASPGWTGSAGGGHVETDNDKPVLASHYWFTGRYKAILSSFVASTIDHLLMGALQSKQLPIRHVGLADKVVIIDEAHASSSFMNYYAVRVMEWLGAYGTPVIILSATLPSSLRIRLSEAYMKGLKTAEAALASPAASPGIVEDVSASTETATYIEEPYPRISVVDRTGVKLEGIAPATKPREVTLRAHTNEVELAQFVTQLAQDRSGNILVVCNTVRVAQAVYSQLKDQFGGAVRLCHSRFTVQDRLRTDRELLDLYGPDSSIRPEFSIVVATQVVEQSLDVDFDVLVSQLAPVDLILQRIGRVHRHAGRVRPECFSKPVCHLVDVPDFDSKPELDGGSRKVYRDLRLLSAAAVLGPELFSENGRVVVLPDEVGDLVERAEREVFPIPEAWVEDLKVAKVLESEQEKKAEEEVKHGWIISPDTKRGMFQTLDDWVVPGGDPEGKKPGTRAKVRDGIEDVEVILLQEVDGLYYTMPSPDSPDGLPLPRGVQPNPGTALAAAMGTVRIPRYYFTDGVLSAAEALWDEEWETSPLLRGQLFVPLVGGVGRLDSISVKYSREKGLEIEYGNKLQ